MSRRRVLIGLVVIAFCGSVSYALIQPETSVQVFGLGSGSRLNAERWRTRFDKFPDPTAAAAAYPEVEIMQFANGEWVFGISDDSHRSHWGGTVVVKDSTGRVRAFLGHVCGPNYFRRLKDSRSLAEFYGHGEWRYWRFREYVFR
jgi:hypothetical protein